MQGGGASIFKFEIVLGWGCQEGREWDVVNPFLARCTGWGSIPQGGFPETLAISKEKYCSVQEARALWEGTWGGLETLLQKKFFACEEKLRVDLMTLLSPIVFPLVEDSWIWEDGVYYVKLADDPLLQRSPPPASRDPLEIYALEKQWKSLAPPKVVSFTRRVLKNRISPRANLF